MVYLRICSNTDRLVVGVAKRKFMNLKENERKDALWCGEGGCKGVGEGVLGIGGWLVGVWVDGAC